MPDRTFGKGDRVRTNDLWASRASGQRNLKSREPRAGVIAQKPQSGKECYAVLWDGRRSIDYVVGRFLEREPPLPTLEDVHAIGVTIDRPGED